MRIKRNRREVTSGTNVTCPVEYKGLTGCDHALTYFSTNDAGLIECPTDVPARAHTAARAAARGLWDPRSRVVRP